MFLEVKEVAREKGQRLQEESKLPRHSSQIPAALIGQICNMVEREPGKCVVSADLNIFRGSICKKIEGLDSVMQQAEFTLPDLTGFYVTPRSPISPPHDPSPCPRAPPGHHCLSQCDWHPQDTVSGSPPHFFSGQNQMAGGMVLSPGKVQGTLTPLFGRLSSPPEGLPVAQSLASLQM